MKDTLAGMAYGLIDAATDALDASSFYHSRYVDNHIFSPEFFVPGGAWRAARCRHGCGCHGKGPKPWRWPFWEEYARPSLSQLIDEQVMNRRASLSCQW